MAEETPGDKPTFRDRLRSLTSPRRPEIRGGKADEPKPGEGPTETLGEKSPEPDMPKPDMPKPDMPKPDMPARIDGLRGWLEEVERRQGRMTYFGAAAALIALIASGAALFLGISANQDSASKDQLDEVKAEITQLRTELEQSNAQKLQSVNQQLTSLQQQLKTLQTKQNQQATDITQLKQRPVQQAPAPAPTTPTTGGSKNP